MLLGGIFCALVATVEDTQTKGTCVFSCTLLSEIVVLEIHLGLALATSINCIYFLFLGLLGVRLTFGLLGKFFLTLAYDVIYTWTVELFPTQIRYFFTFFIFLQEYHLTKKYPINPGLYENLLTLGVAYGPSIMSPTKHNWRMHFDR